MTPLFTASQLDHGYICDWEVMMSKTEASAYLVRSQKEDALLWHARLGHTNFSALAKMASEGHVTGLNLCSHDFAAHKDDICPICVQARHDKASHKSSGKEYAPGECIHVDLCGPYQVPSIYGEKYTLMIVDAGSNAYSCLPLKAKSEVQQFLPGALLYIANLAGRDKPLIVRSDNGGEFVSSVLNDWFQATGIKHEYSVAYVHEMNGRAENAIKQINNVARALLINANMPEYLWNAVVQHACYLHNRVYSRAVDATPWYKLTGRIPDIAKVRVFGCLVYYKVPEIERKTRLSPKSKIGFYMGVCMKTGESRVLVKPNANTLLIKSYRDVIAVERYLTHPSVPVVQCFEHQPGAPAGQAALHPNSEGQILPETSAGLVSPWGCTPSTSPLQPQQLKEYAENHLPLMARVLDLITGEDVATVERRSGGDEDVQGVATGTEHVAVDGQQGVRSNTELGVEPRQGVVTGTEYSEGQFEGGTAAEGARRHGTGVPDMPDQVRINEGQDRGAAQLRLEPDRLAHANQDRPDPVDGRRYPARVRSRPDRFVPALAAGAITMKRCGLPGRLLEYKRGANLSAAIQAGLDHFHTSRAFATTAHTHEVDTGAAEIVIPSDSVEPHTYNEAVSGPYAERWGESIADEWNSLLMCDTFKRVKRRVGMKVIPCKWVFKYKKDSEGKICRFKSRLVAGGHRQKHGIDFEETFAPTSRHTTIRAFLSTVVNEDMFVKQLDIKTAFLHGDIDIDVYMEQPPGYKEGKDVVLKLEKCLYGLKQAPRQWHHKLTDYLRSLGFKPSLADPSLWSGSPFGSKVLIAIVVDDTLLACKSKGELDRVIKSILDRFEGTTGPAEWYCGMKLNWQPDGSLILTQKSHIEKILKTHGLEQVKTRTLPVSVDTVFGKEGTPLDPEIHMYSSLVGALLYISVSTRPDIAMCVNRLAKYMAYPTVQLWDIAVKLCGYLKYTIDYGLHLRKGGEVKLYCDADYASDPDKRRSHTGWCFLLHGSVISWQSKCQPTVACSTVEAEYQSVSMATKEALWLRQLLPELGLDPTPMQIMCDSLGALRSLKNPIITQRTKHIDVMHHFVRERVADGYVHLEFIPGEHNIADLFTKPLPGPKFTHFRKLLGVVQIPSSIR